MIDVKESAAGHGSYERIRLLNDKAIVAVINDDTHALNSSLALGAEPWIREGRFGLSMLHFAALHGNRESVAALLERQADPCSVDSSNFLPLQRAIHHGHWDVCEQLLSAMEGWPAPADVKAEEVLAVAVGLLVDLQQSTLARRLVAWWRPEGLFGMWSEWGWAATVRRAWDGHALEVPSNLNLSWIFSSRTLNFRSRRLRKFQDFPKCVCGGWKVGEI